MLNARTYMVRPFIELRNKPRSLRRISYGFSQLLVGPALSFDREQIKVRSSTRATSLGSERARKQPGHNSSFSLVNEPLATISRQSLSYSACEPSTQWMSLGLVSSAVFSTHLTRCILRVSGPRERAVFIAILNRKWEQYQRLRCALFVPSILPEMGMKCLRADIGHQPRIESAGAITVTRCNH